MTPIGGLLAGGVGGVLVIFSILFFQKLKVDDPVGAVSVHGVCGVWGTMACAIPLFCRPDEAAKFTTQLIGVVAIFAFVFSTTLAFFYLLKMTIGLRVTKEEELGGLDIFEHGSTSYLFESE